MGEFEVLVVGTSVSSTELIMKFLKAPLSEETYARSSTAAF